MNEVHSRPLRCADTLPIGPMATKRDIFRKDALARHESPEHLDHLLCVVAVDDRILMGVTVLLTAGVFWWGLSGSLPRTVVVENAEISVSPWSEIDAPTRGFVHRWAVALGDTVEVGEVIGDILALASPESAGPPGEVDRPTGIWIVPVTASSHGIVRAVLKRIGDPVEEGTGVLSLTPTEPRRITWRVDVDLGTDIDVPELVGRPVQVRRREGRKSLGEPTAGRVVDYELRPPPAVGGEIRPVRLLLDLEDGATIDVATEFELRIPLDPARPFALMLSRFHEGQ